MLRVHEQQLYPEASTPRPGEVADPAQGRTVDRAPRLVALDGTLNYWATLVTEPEPVTPAVEAVTRAPARTFREWAIDHTRDFR